MPKNRRAHNIASKVHHVQTAGRLSQSYSRSSTEHSRCQQPHSITVRANTEQWKTWPAVPGIQHYMHYVIYQDGQSYYFSYRLPNLSIRLPNTINPPAKGERHQPATVERRHQSPDPCLTPASCDQRQAPESRSLLRGPGISHSSRAHAGPRQLTVTARKLGNTTGGAET